MRVRVRVRVRGRGRGRVRVRVRVRVRLRLRVPAERLVERGHVVHGRGILVVIGAVGVLEQLHLLLGHLQRLAVVAPVEELVHPLAEPLALGCH